MCFLLIMKRNDYYKIHKKFQVHITNLFGLGAKTNIARWQPPLPSTPNFESLPYPYPRAGCFFFFLKCPQRMILQLGSRNKSFSELENPFSGGNHPPSVGEGIYIFKKKSQQVMVTFIPLP